jgi:hypothetical protein
VESGFTATDGGAGTPARWLKRCGDIWDTHPGFNVVGEDLKVADGGGLDFLSFDDVARPHPRSSGPRDWFPRFLALSSRSYLV